MIIHESDGSDADLDPIDSQFEHRWNAAQKAGLLMQEIGQAVKLKTFPCRTRQLHPLKIRRVHLPTRNYSLCRVCVAPPENTPIKINSVDVRPLSLASIQTADTAHTISCGRSQLKGRASMEASSHHCCRRRCTHLMVLINHSSRNTSNTILPALQCTQ